MSADGGGNIYITWEEWTNLVLLYAPFLKDTQFSLGPPREDEDGVVVPYAFGTDVHPRDRAEPPEWLKGTIR